MSNYNPKPVPSARQQIKLIQEKQRLLAIAMQAAGGPIGLKALTQLMQLGNVDNSSTSPASHTIVEILEEVKASGVPLTPGLVSLLKNSPYQNVRNGIDIFKTYPKSTLKNPAGLLYKIIANENLQAG